MKLHEVSSFPEFLTEVISELKFLRKFLRDFMKLFTFSFCDPQRPQRQVEAFPPFENTEKPFRIAFFSATPTEMAAFEKGNEETVEPRRQSDNRQSESKV